jgi:hypothetical protein
MALTLEDLDRRVSALERTRGDTTESLRWAAARLGRIQAVQDEHTLRLERVEARLDSVDELPRAIAELIDASERRLMAAIANH